MKTNSTMGIVVLTIIAIVIGAFGSAYLIGGQGQLSTTENSMVVNPATGQAMAPWAKKIVNYKLLVSDKYTGADVTATVKVYKEKPSDWENPRGDFSDAENYNIYTVTNGEALINKEFPGTYYAVITKDGYNTEFVSFVIPDGTGRGDISDYQQSPDIDVVEMTQEGSTTNQDAEFTLTNATSKELRKTVLVTVDENTEFRGWKVIVNDEEGFSEDTDGDGVYDEGISKFKITVGSQTKTVFDASRSVDEFDSNDKYQFDLSDVVGSDQDLTIKVDIVADTSDSVGANDEKWGEGEGVLSYIKIYDAQGNLFETTAIKA